jgi:anti-sigma-K factor RskA
MSDEHERVQSLLAAYVLGAVPEDEIPAIRAHILSCETCFREADSYEPALAGLTALAAPEELPDGFADRVVAAARDPFESASEPAGDRSSHRRRVPRLARLGAAAAIVTFLVAGVALFETVSTRDRYERALAAIVAGGDSFELAGAGGAEGVIAESSTGSVLVAVDLGEAPADHDYQLWLMKDGEPVPAETFDVSDGVVLVESRHGLDGFDGAAITVEPEGGSQAPTTEPVLVSS